VPPCLCDAFAVLPGCVLTLPDGLFAALEEVAFLVALVHAAASRLSETTAAAIVLVRLMLTVPSWLVR